MRLLFQLALASSRAEITRREASGLEVEADGVLSAAGPAKDGDVAYLPPSDWSVPGVEAFDAGRPYHTWRVFGEHPTIVQLPLPAVCLRSGAVADTSLCEQRLLAAPRLCCKLDEAPLEKQYREVNKEANE